MSKNTRSKCAIVVVSRMVERDGDVVQSDEYYGPYTLAVAESVAEYVWSNHPDGFISATVEPIFKNFVIGG